MGEDDDRDGPGEDDDDAKEAPYCRSFFFFPQKQCQDSNSTQHTCILSVDDMHVCMIYYDNPQRPSTVGPSCSTMSIYKRGAGLITGDSTYINIYTYTHR